MLNPNMQTISSKILLDKSVALVALHTKGKFLCCKIPKIENDQNLLKLAQIWHNSPSLVSLMG